jgi:hypothetical protein
LYYFLFISFIIISHEKVLSEAMCTQKYVYLLIFLMRFLQRDIRDIRYADSVSPKLSYYVIRVFHGITKLDPLFFPLDF